MSAALIFLQALVASAKPVSVMEDSEMSRNSHELSTNAMRTSSVSNFRLLAMAASACLMSAGNMEDMSDRSSMISSKYCPRTPTHKLTSFGGDFFFNGGGNLPRYDDEMVRRTDAFRVELESMERLLREEESGIIS